MQWIAVCGFVFVVSTIPVIHTMEQHDQLSAVVKEDGWVPLKSVLMANGCSCMQGMCGQNVTTIDLPADHLQIYVRK
jgi:hypothetical protein